MGLTFLSERIGASIYIGAFRLLTLRQVELETAQTDPPEVQPLSWGDGAVAAWYPPWMNTVAAVSPETPALKTEQPVSRSDLPATSWTGDTDDGEEFLRELQALEHTELAHD